MKNWKILLVNCVITLTVIGILYIYIHNQNIKIAQNEIHNFENTAFSMEKILYSYMTSEQQLVNSWANIINSNDFTMDNAILFLKDSIGKRKASAHIIWEDDYSKGFSTQGKVADPDDITVSYEIDALKQYYEASTKRVLDNIKDNKGVINLTACYTNPITGNKTIGFGKKVKILQNGEKRNAFLLYVLPVDTLKTKWVFSTEYKNISVAIIQNDGTYIIQPDAMKNTNFYEFINSYNDLTQDELKNRMYENKLGSFKAKDSKGDLNIYAYSVVNETLNHIVILGMPYDDLSKGPTGWAFIVITTISLLLALAFNIMIFNHASKKEHNQYEIIKNQGKQLEQALIEAQHASNSKTIFLNNMSHDIRTPMNAIMGFTSLAENNIENTSLVQDYLRKISISSSHLLSLINDVLDMSRIESGKVKIELQEESLPNIVRELRNIVQSDFKEKDLHFNIDTSGVVHEKIICDKLRINQIFINIISNATKFTQRGGCIGVKIIEKESDSNGFANFEFRVKDNGIGMSEEFIKHIFEPFSREENSTVNGILGSGLGMTITKNIIDMLDGTIEVESKQGVGSEFIVNLRFRVNSRNNIINIGNEFENKRAFIVDDSMDSCISLSEILKKFSIRPEWTTSGKEAVYRLKSAKESSDKFSIFIVNKKIADMDCYELLKNIRSIYSASEASIMLVSNDWVDIEYEARNNGVNCFCEKPYFISECYSALKNPIKVQPSVGNTKTEPGLFKGKRVLLVDDVELNRDLAIAVLEESGAEIETCENGAEAVEKIANSKPGYFNLILMDIMMPVMDGYEATKQIRQLEDKTLANIPIIAMTANAFEEDKKVAIACGMNNHIAKPFRIDTFYEVMKKYL